MTAPPTYSSHATATLEHARMLDHGDAFPTLRPRFHVPLDAEGREIAYFCGNSLGLQPRATEAELLTELDTWARLAVDGHFDGPHPWMRTHEEVAAPLARIVGALPSEVVAMNTLTVNLHLLLVSFYRPEGRRRKIIIEEKAFPSDQYAVMSQLRFHGCDPEHDLIELPLGEDGLFDRQRALDLIHLYRDEAAMLLLGGVNYYNGQLFDIPALIDAAHAAGMVAGLDLAHAAGNVPLHLHEWNADFAVWCSYKYLNSGPGGTAACFVHARHEHAPDLPRFSGWWGHDPATRFAMPRQFMPAPGADGWQLSNPAVLPMAALRASLALFEEAGMPALRAKSLRLTGWLEQLLRAGQRDTWSIITPADPEQRGCQLSIRLHERGRACFDHLHRQGIVCDWREPDVIRAAPVPMYNTFEDVWRLADAFHTFWRDSAV